MGECREAGRRRGTPLRQYWWEQDLEVELPELVQEDEAEGEGPRRHAQPARAQPTRGHDVLRRRQLRELEEERAERRRGAPLQGEEGRS